ncbi:MAG TPA: sodium:solute symporter [Actinomycetota bacterium]|nr:sodium:solute symporter [Actinomycetota bacterium]
MVDPMLGLAAAAAALALFAWVGVRGRVREDLDDYLTARGSQPAVPLGLSFLASGLGAWILFAPPEVGAFVGPVAVVGYAVAAASPVVAFGLLGPRLRRIVPAGHSLTGFLRLRFGRVLHTYVAAISVLYMLVFVIAELTAVGAVTAVMTGGSGAPVIVATAAATVAYTAYAGLRASIRTDRWQAWMVVGLLGAAAVAWSSTIGDPEDALSRVEVRFDQANLEAAATLVLAVLAANIFHQGYWQRVWAAESDRALRRGAALGAALTVPVVAVTGLAGVLVSSTGADLGRVPVPFFAPLTALLWVVGVGVVVLGVSLVASSVDTLTNALASLVVAERPRLGMRGARLVTLALMVPAVALALQGWSVLRVFLIADLLAATVAVPVVLGVWRRATAAGAIAGAVAGLAGSVLIGLRYSGSVGGALRQVTFPGGVPTLWPFLGAVGASTVVTVVVSLLWRRVADLDSLDARVPTLSGR